MRAAAQRAVASRRGAPQVRGGLTAWRACARRCGWRAQFGVGLAFIGRFITFFNTTLVTDVTSAYVPAVLGPKYVTSRLPSIRPVSALT